MPVRRNPLALNLISPQTPRNAEARQLRGAECMDCLRAVRIDLGMKAKDRHLIFVRFRCIGLGLQANDEIDNVSGRM